jgi:uncharacterized secreted protein with C-terminal beta-propeller domain
MARRKQFWKKSYLRRSARGPFAPRVTRSRRLPLHLEQLEPRMLMDGAGFVHTDPEPDPDSVVGVAVIAAQDDYVKVRSGTQQLRIDVLGNDPLPDGSDKLHIKSVSDTRSGATVAISDDGTRIIYTAPEGGVTFDTFYYIVEDGEGNLGKANVNVGSKTSSVRPPIRYSGNDRYTFFEDSPEQELNVLHNDGPFSGGEIIEVVATYSPHGTMRIAADGKSLFYQPEVGFSGRENYQYTVRNESGETSTSRIHIEIKKPFGATRSEFFFDIDGGPFVLDIIAEGIQYGPTPESPRLISITGGEHSGELTISEDGQTVLFEPNKDFIGSFTYSYTVRYGPAEYQTTTGTGWIQVQNTFLAVDNWFTVDPDSSGNPLDVLANDPLLPRGRRVHGQWPSSAYVTLQIVAVGTCNQGGEIVIEDGKALRYTPAVGFLGEETFSYTVEDSTGHRDSATVTVHVADPIIDPVGAPKSILPGELEQFLIDQAVERFKNHFGVYNLPWRVATNWPSDVIMFGNAEQSVLAAAADIAKSSSTGYSQTNTQEAGVDEADIVETDGRYIYTFSRGQLVIADMVDPENPLLVSFTEFDDSYSEMYLQGDRMTLIHRGRFNSPAVVTVLDVSDRTSPSIIERTEINGTIVDSRAVGDQVYVVVSGLQIPVLESHIVYTETESGRYGTRVNETLDAYVSRVRETLLETALPTYRTFAGDGTLLAEGLLTDPTQIHKPLDDFDTSLLSLVTFDVGDDLAGPVASTGIFTTVASEVYMSGNSFYVMRNGCGETAIFKFDIADDGTPSLVATGKVGGTLLNQFSVDEHDGHFRIATTQVVQETYVDAWGRTRFRQQQRFNNLFVLEQLGSQLVVVGSVENLAPTETIKSVRFLDDRAYVVTFRVVDPLFAVDLSDPTNPTVAGALKISGYSDYLHPVGKDYVIGIGRDADEITGRLGPVQISLFYVGDLSDPTLVDQVTMEGARWTSSEAWSDHHAVAYFAEDQVLTIPVSWTEENERHSAIWAFEIEVDQEGGGSIEVSGSVEHKGQARRSIRLGDTLVTISQDTIKVNDLDDVDEQLAELNLGPLPQDDQFTVEEGSQGVVLDVRANDLLAENGAAPLIVGVTQPTEIYSWGVSRYVQLSVFNPNPLMTEEIGTVEIADDGRSLVFTPNENYFGTATFKYTVFDELRGEQVATVTVTVENVPDQPEAVNDEFDVEPGSGPTMLNVLANDVNVDGSQTSQLGYNTFSYYAVDLSDLRPTTGLTEGRAIDQIPLDSVLSVATDAASFNDWTPFVPTVFQNSELTITAVGPTDHGGTVEIGEWGQLVYTPAAGFEGVETFTYTITTQFGLSDVGAVTVRVGAESSTEAAAQADPYIIEKLASRSGGFATDVFTASLFDSSAQVVHRDSVDREQTDSMIEQHVSNGIEKLPDSNHESHVIDRALSSETLNGAQEIFFSLDDELFDCLARDLVDCDQQ